LNWGTKLGGGKKGRGKSGANKKQSGSERKAKRHGERSATRFGGERGNKQHESDARGKLMGDPGDKERVNEKHGGGLAPGQKSLTTEFQGSQKRGGGWGNDGRTVTRCAGENQEQSPAGGGGRG